VLNACRWLRHNGFESIIIAFIGSNRSIATHAQGRRYLYMEIFDVSNGVASRNTPSWSVLNEHAKELKTEKAGMMKENNYIPEIYSSACNSSNK
jgi:hypothetical protein